MDHQSSLTKVSSIELAAMLMIRATSRCEWKTSISKLVHMYDTLELTVSTRAAEEMAGSLVDHYREVLASRQESHRLIDAVFDQQHGSWQG